MPFRIAPTPVAADQIRRESRWWRRNRSKAPSLFRDELRRALALIAEYPDAGPIAEDVSLEGVRRVFMAGSQHFVYYRPNLTSKRIEVLAVWSAHRGEAPPL